MVEGSSSFSSVVSHKNILQIVAEIRLLREQARIIVAGELLSRVDRFLATGEQQERKEVKEARTLLAGELRTSFDEVRQRAAECRGALDDWHSPDWLLAQTFMGITTSYKHDPDGSLWIKMHGTMDGVRVMDQIATVREVDLFSTWVPFCDTSKLLKRLGIVDLLVYFSMSVPGASRDCVLHAYGCDSVLEDNCILIQGRSVDQWEEVHIPEVKGWGHGRMDVRAFRAKIEVLSPTSACTSIVANVDPKAPLPRAMVNYVVRKAAGMFLYCLKQTARRINADEGNCHFQRIAEDEEFYKHWLFPRFERFYNLRGWAVDGGITIGGSSGRSVQSSARIGGASGRTKGVSRQFCLPFRLKSGKRSKEPPAYRKPRRQPQKRSVDVSQPQVESLGIDPRLVQKWRAKRDVRRDVKSTALLSRVLFIVAVLRAMCASSAHWLYVSDGRAANRLRSLFALACLLAFVVFVYFVSCAFYGCVCTGD